jgi:hypothetical protein
MEKCHALETRSVVGLQVSIRKSGDVTILDVRGRSTVDSGESELLGSHLQELEIQSPWGVRMPCKSCGSVNQKKFSAEMGIHFPELKDIDKPVVWLFPELVVCLDCGTAEFAVPEAELRLLAKGDAAAAG